MYLQVDLVGAPPDWLYCWSGYWMIGAGWMAARPPPCAFLHLVECRSQFAHFSQLDTLKANRPYVMGAYQRWQLPKMAPVEHHSQHRSQHRSQRRTPPPHADSVRAVWAREC